MCNQNAFQYLDGLCQGITILSQGTALWHAGITNPALPPTAINMIWTTKNELNKHFYDDRAKDDAKKLNQPAFRLTLQTTKHLQLANFGGTLLYDFSKNFCSSIYEKIDPLLYAWIKDRDLDGIISIHGVDEVLISEPNTNLKTVSHIYL